MLSHAEAEDMETWRGLREERVVETEMKEEQGQEGEVQGDGYRLFLTANDETTRPAGVHDLPADYLDIPAADQHPLPCDMSPSLLSTRQLLLFKGTKCLTF